MKKELSKNLTFSVVVEKDRDGYVAECREFQGCYAEGNDYEEVIKNIKEVIELHLEDRIYRGDLIVSDLNQNNISLTTLSFALPRNVA